MNNGILNIYKPQNMTSHDVVSIVRRTLKIKKVGHTGTLDPMATGVLPVCVGQATRIIEYLDMDFKTYKCEMLLGMETDTLDIWGEVVCRCNDIQVSKSDIEAVISRFHGLVTQVPPKYSALKVNGKRLYEYARNGEDVEIKSREIFIKNFKMDNIDIENKKLIFTVECSKGTYIRTICDDIGRALGCGGTMTALERIGSGAFEKANSIDLEEFRKLSPDEGKALFLPAEYPLIHFGKIIVDEKVGKRFMQGWHLPIPLCKFVEEPEYKNKEFHIPLRNEYKNAYKIFMKEETHNEAFIGIAFYSEKYDKFVADKVFCVGDDK